MFEKYSNLVETTYQVCDKYCEKIYLQYLEEEKYMSVSFRQFRERFEYLAASLYHLGFRKSDKAAIISDNRWQWIVSDMAVLSLGGADVPRGSDSTADEIGYILEHSESKFCFVENVEQANKILGLTNRPKHLTTVILLTEAKKDIKVPIHAGITVHTFDELVKQGEKLRTELEIKLQEIRASITGDDLATLIYTSGTTGTPKGVMLLHKNFMHNVRNLPKVMPITEADRWLTILPVWHIFERTIEYIILALGCRMAYSKPVAKYLLPAMLAIKPTALASVPRVWESLHTGIIKAVRSESKLKYGIFRFFFMVGVAFQSCRNVLVDRLPRFEIEFFLVTAVRWLFALAGFIVLFLFDRLGDLLVFSKIRTKTGGCLRIPVSGGGAMPPHIDRFFSIIKIDILEGYGLTETSPVIGVRVPKNKRMFTIGQPIPETEVSIRDEHGVPLSNQHQKGVVWVRGDLVMAGYYKDKKHTDEVMTKDGWFNTGDLGRMSYQGDLQLTGRAKDTIVLIGGENIEPEPIEAKLRENDMISQCMVVGQDKKMLSVIIVPESEKLEQWAHENGIKYHNMDELCSNSKIQVEYKRIVDSKISTRNGFKSFEKIFCLMLLPEPFKVGEELTHSLKMKRNFITEKYKNKIELSCYAQFGK
jgi:long-chain acyl-CoA synthetase